MNVRRTLIVATIVLAALTSACGGEDTDSPAQESPEVSAQPDTEESPPEEGGMPDLSGMTIDEASETLEAILNSYDLKIKYESSAEPSGTVITQTPAAGTPLEAGRIYTVRVTVSK